MFLIIPRRFGNLLGTRRSVRCSKAVAGLVRPLTLKAWAIACLSPQVFVSANPEAPQPRLSDSLWVTQRVWDRPVIGCLATRSLISSDDCRRKLRFQI